MKNILLVILIPFISFSQKIEFIKIDSNLNQSKNELFIKAKTWLANNYVSAKDVIQLEDKEAGKLIAKGFHKVPMKSVFGNVVSYDQIWSIATIEVKDNKYRITINQFNHVAGPNLYGKPDGASYGSLDNDEKPKGMFYSKKMFAFLKKEAIKSAKDFIDSFENYMKSIKSDF